MRCSCVSARLTPLSKEQLRSTMIEVSPIVPCLGFGGNKLILEHDPLETEHYEALFDASKRGLYDYGGKLIVAGSYFFGPTPSVFEGHFHTSIDRAAVRRAPDDDYVYIGWIHEHFGHFLLSTLSRLWGRLSERMIVYSGQHEIDYYFKKSHIGSIFSALGLKPSQFIWLQEDFCFPRISVPSPAFEERNFAFRRFADLCNGLGAVIGRETAHEYQGKPIFLSKARLTSGVRKYLNEGDLNEALEVRGFKIIYPEQLGFPEQVSLWRNNKYITAFSGSALHTSIFAPGSYIAHITEGVVLDTSYALCDGINKSRAQYFRLQEEDVVDRGGETPGFSYTSRLANPTRIAEALQRAVEMAMRSDVEGESLGIRNIALGRPSRQSSFHPWVPRAQPNATSGKLTGSMQFHTEEESCPWWEVALPDGAIVDSIKIYNRCDDLSAMDRGRNIVLMIDDEPVYDHAGAKQFGGIVGDPLIWEAPAPRPAQRVRIMLRGHGHLHLDQVEVFGRIEVA
ncbi:hypothetical protein Mchl_3849 [Methylorubrum extorquens CM4]|uniref:Glycosyltransferase 61 catalytic domain-containing protein n=2 Tax=Methylorubrum extorquens TaxID=408 RepID=B7KXQ9_METC4|nr:hypothetical protein Mchl_3849 [Methylorubrum extorquens CM4]